MERYIGQIGIYQEYAGSGVYRLEDYKNVIIQANSMEKAVRQLEDYLEKHNRIEHVRRSENKEYLRSRYDFKRIIELDRLEIIE